MFEDPKALTVADWENIHIWLQWLWIYLPLIVTFVLTMVVAHAILPSLVLTGHLPRTVLRLRTPMTGFALVVLAAAIVILVLAINQTLTVENFWDRYLI